MPGTSPGMTMGWRRGPWACGPAARIRTGRGIKALRRIGFVSQFRVRYPARHDSRSFRSCPATCFIVMPGLVPGIPRLGVGGVGRGLAGRRPVSEQDVGSRPCAELGSFRNFASGIPRAMTAGPSGRAPLPASSSCPDLFRASPGCGRGPGNAARTSLPPSRCRTEPRDRDGLCEIAAWTIQPPR